MVRAVSNEWTAWTEAISFVSATLGDTFSAAQGNGLYWDTLSTEASDGYPVALERIGSEVKVVVNFHGIGGDHADVVKLWALIGWATEKKHMVEVV